MDNEEMLVPIDGEVEGNLNPEMDIDGEVEGDIDSDTDIDGEVEGDINSDAEIDGDAAIPAVITEKSYLKLEDKPTINGTELYDNYDEIDPTVPDWAKTQSKPSYTPDEIGAVNGRDTLKYDEIDRMFNAVFGT